MVTAKLKQLDERITFLEGRRAYLWQRISVAGGIPDRQVAELIACLDNLVESYKLKMLGR